MLFTEIFFQFRPEEIEVNDSYGYQPCGKEITSWDITIIESPHSTNYSDQAKEGEQQKDNFFQLVHGKDFLWLYLDIYVCPRTSRQIVFLPLTC